MVVVPATTPVTFPETSTEPLPGVVLLHTPLPVASDNEIVLPKQTLDAPEILPAEGNAFTVSKELVVQPAVEVNTIVAVPADTPATEPLPEPMVTEPEPLTELHVPEKPSVSVVEAPTHTARLPFIEVGVGLTVTAKLPLTEVGEPAPKGCTLVNV